MVVISVYIFHRLFTHTDGRSEWLVHVIKARNQVCYMTIYHAHIDLTLMNTLHVLLYTLQMDWPDSHITPVSQSNSSTESTILKWHY